MLAAQKRREAEERAQTQAGHRGGGFGVQGLGLGFRVSGVWV